MQIEKLRGKALDELFDAILTLENREECYQFFDDLCTVMRFNRYLNDCKSQK